MGVGGDVVRLFYKLPNRDLTEDYWVNEREGDGEVFSFHFFIGIPVKNEL